MDAPMFQERPYRQQRQATWSIWWFVAFMAAGLTMWHLELIPFTHQHAHTVLQDQMNDEFLEGFPEKFPADETTAESSEINNQVELGAATSLPPGQFEPP